MTNKEKKAYIIKHWRTSSGKKITEMTQRYWISVAEEKKSGKTDMVDVAKKIFNV